MARAFETKPGRAPLPAAQRPAAPTRTVPPAADFPQLARRLHLGAPIQRRAGDGPGRDFSGIAGPGRPPLPGGLPAGLRADVEARSGLPMDDVRVHRNSPKPRTIGALAYAQGRDIHLGPGQERHLAHEAWHVVQQKQGRVRATSLKRGMAINDDVGLEREAETRALRRMQGIPAGDHASAVVQGVFYSKHSDSGTFVLRHKLPKLLGVLDEQLTIHGSGPHEKAKVLAKFKDMENDSKGHLIEEFFAHYKKLPLRVKDSVAGIHTEEKIHKYDRAKLDKKFNQSGVALEGLAVSGFYPKDKKYLLSKNSGQARDFAGHRVRQVLHHFSEVIFHDLKETADKKDDPIEVQVAHWIDKDGQDRLSISANNRDAQLLIHKMTAKYVTVMLNKYASNSGKSQSARRAQKSADKLKKIKNANVRRLKKDEKKFKSTGVRRENRADMELAEKLAKMLRRRDFSVAINDEAKKHKVHAEQVLESAIDRQGGIRKDVAGVKIRCGSCTLRIGIDKKQTALTGTDSSGKLYHAQYEDTGGMAEKLLNKELVVDKHGSGRTESDSEIDTSIDTDTSFGTFQSPIRNTPPSVSALASSSSLRSSMTNSFLASPSKDEDRSDRDSDQDEKSETETDLSDVSDEHSDVSLDFSDSDYDESEDDKSEDEASRARSSLKPKSSTGTGGKSKPTSVIATSTGTSVKSKPPSVTATSTGTGGKSKPTSVIATSTGTSVKSKPPSVTATSTGTGTKSKPASVTTTSTDKKAAKKNFVKANSSSSSSDASEESDDSLEISRTQDTSESEYSERETSSEDSTENEKDETYIDPSERRRNKK